MSEIFYDMVGKPIHVGDLFVIPGGNPRFGGLKLHLGLVVSRTDKTMTCDYFELPDGKPKGSGRKSPSKVLKIDPHYYLNYCKLFDELRERGNALKINCYLDSCELSDELRDSANALKINTKD